MMNQEKLFTFRGTSIGFQVSDFFEWWCGDMLTNSVRGVLAEYIVAMALGCEKAPRLGAWNEFDLLGPNGTRVEVKSSAYLQSWKQRKLSKIVFSIAPSRRYNEDSASYEAELKRHSDVYVFCVFECVDRQRARLSALEQWGFYVMRTSEVDRRFRDQKTVSLSSLLKTGIKRIDYPELCDAVML